MKRGPARNPNGKNVKLPEAFLALIESTHKNVGSWRELRVRFRVAKRPIRETRISRGGSPEERVSDTVLYRTRGDFTVSCLIIRPPHLSTSQTTEFN